jgi:hypothetical protein
MIKINMTFNFIILRYLIAFVANEEELWKGYFYAVLIFSSAAVQTLLLAQYFNRMVFVNLRIRTALISAIYRKVRMCYNLYNTITPWSRTCLHLAVWEIFFQKFYSCVCIRSCHLSVSLKHMNPIQVFVSYCIIKFHLQLPSYTPQHLSDCLFWSCFLAKILYAVLICYVSSPSHVLCLNSVGEKCSLLAIMFNFEYIHSYWHFCYVILCCCL